jgi:flagellar motility protein MotE (MotC chaperone)
MTALSLRAAAITAVLCLAAPELAAETPPAEGNAGDIRQVIEEYCVAVSDAAAERRMVNQTTALKELEARMEEKIKLLEQEKSALEVLLKRREDLRNLAKRELVEIYAVMDAEAASQQLEQLDVRLASSVLRQLKPRQASAILNEMNPETAARMAKVIASAAPGRKEEQ